MLRCGMFGIVVKKNLVSRDKYIVQFFLALWFVTEGLDVCALELFVVEVELTLLFKFSLSLNVAVSFFKFLGDVESSARCNGI